MIRLHIHDRHGHRVLDADQFKRDESGKFTSGGGSSKGASKPTPKSFWSYKAASATPEHEAAVSSGRFRGSKADWEGLSPGMRREIMRGHKGQDGAEGSTGTQGTAWGGTARKPQRPDKPAALKAGAFSADAAGAPAAAPAAPAPAPAPAAPPARAMGGRAMSGRQGGGGAPGGRHPGLPGARPQLGPQATNPQQSPQGMSHQQAALQHEQAAAQYVGLNFGTQNPLSRAHTEAAKAHKIAMGLLGKIGYEQAAAWAASASQHAGRLAASRSQQQPAQPQMPAQPPQRPAGGPNRLPPTHDAGTSIGGRRGHATRRHRSAEDEASSRRSWLPGWLPGQSKDRRVVRDTRSIDAWFYDFDESKVKRDEGGKFSSTGGGGGGKSEEGDKPSSSELSKSKSPASDLYKNQGHIPTEEEFWASRSQEDRNAARDVEDEVNQHTATNEDPRYVDAEGNYKPARQREHERILAKLFTPEAMAAARPAPGEKPTFYMIGGRGGSGKSWFTSEGGRLGNTKAIKLDCDEFKAALPGYEPHLAAVYHEEASHVLETALQFAREQGLNVTLDATMKTTGSALKKADAYKKAGYRIEGHYMFAPMEHAVNGAFDRFKHGKNGPYSGRYVPPSYILSSTTNEETFDKLQDYFDDWSVYDNSEAAAARKRGERSTPKLVAQRE